MYVIRDFRGFWLSRSARGLWWSPCPSLALRWRAVSGVYAWARNVGGLQAGYGPDWCGWISAIGAGVVRHRVGDCRRVSVDLPAVA